MKVYFSHTGINYYEPELDILHAGTYITLIDQINQLDGYSELKNRISKENRIISGARIFINVLVKNEVIAGNTCYKFYENENTKEITNLSLKIGDDIDNILITIFDAKNMLKMINNCLTEQPKRFEYHDAIGKQKDKEYKATINNINFDYDVIKEEIYEFRNGDTTLESLKFLANEEPVLKFEGNDFVKDKSKILPEDLVDAIREIWELSDVEGTLRLFQEDSLFFIMAKLMEIGYPKEKQLLLSMPTGERVIIVTGCINVLVSRVSGTLNKYISCIA